MTDAQVNAVQDIFIVLHNIHQSDGISILININRVADGDVLHTLSLLPKVHEYLICYPHLMELHSPRKVWPPAKQLLHHGQKGKR